MSYSWFQANRVVTRSELHNEEIADLFAAPARLQLPMLLYYL